MTPTELGKATGAAHENLASRFGGMLAPVTPTPQDAEETPEREPGGADTTPSVDEAPQTTQRRAAGKRRAKQAAAVVKAVPSPAQAVDNGQHAGAVAAVQVSLPESVMARLIAYKKSSGLSHPNILFDAIEATADRLPELIKENTVTVGSTGRSLFNRPQTVAKRSTDGEPKKTFIVRISEENKAVVDGLVEQTGAPSRNALFTAAYEAFLPSTD